MSTKLGTLTLDLIAKIGGFTGPMDKARDKVKKNTDQMLKDAKDFGKKFGLALGAGITAGGAALIKYTADGLSAVDSQAKLARSLDTTYDSVTALNMAFGDAGVDGYEASLNRLNRRLGAAALGRGSALKAVEELNLNLSELAALPADERLAVIADRIKDVSANSAEAARYAQDLGFEQKEAAQFFLQGGDAIRSYTNDVKELGLSLSDFEIKKVEQAIESMGIFGDIVDSVKQRLAVQAAPYLEYIGTAIEDTVREMGGFDDVAEMVFDNIISGAAFVVDAVDGIKRVFIIAGNAMVTYWAGALTALAATAARTLELLDNVPTIGLAIDQDTIRGLREFQQTQANVAKQGLDTIQQNATSPLGGDKLRNFAAQMKEDLAEQRRLFEENNKESEKGVESAKQQVNQQQELNKELMKTGEIMKNNAAGSGGSNLQSLFDDYVGVASTEVATGSSFADSQINTLREILKSQQNNGQDLEFADRNKTIIEQLAGGQVPTGGGAAGSDNPASMVQDFFQQAKEIAEQSGEYLKAIDLKAQSIVDIFQQDLPNIGELTLKLDGGNGDIVEAQVQANTEQIGNLQNFLNNFVNDQARADGA